MSSQPFNSFDLLSLVIQSEERENVTTLVYAKKFSRHFCARSPSTNSRGEYNTIGFPRDVRRPGQAKLQLTQEAPSSL